MQRIGILLLLLAGCPDEYEATTVDNDYDMYSGEDVEWSWGHASCVVYMRDPSQRTSQARWFDGNRLVASGPLSQREDGGYMRRGFYRDGGKLAIEDGKARTRRFFYDTEGRVSEIVERGQYDAIHKTLIMYDDRDRMIERHTERSSMWPLVERWTYNPYGWVESYVAEANGQTSQIFLVQREPSNLVTATRSWQPNVTTVHEFGYTSSRVTHVNRYTLGATSGQVFLYEYDDKGRIIARTVAPSLTDEAGARTELDYGEKDVIESRDLTANGLLRSRSVYERDPNGDMRVRTDSNADGEFDQLVDLRDECYGTPAVPEFAAIFSPRITIEGEPPYRPEP